jgi:zinc protease
MLPLPPGERAGERGCRDTQTRAPRGAPPLPSLSPEGRGFWALCALFLLLAFPARAIEIQRVVSPGGIEAWLVVDKSVPVVALEAAFTGGAATDPKEKPGLANLTASLLDEGAGPFDSQAYQKRIEDIASSIRFTASHDNVTASLKTLAENVDTAFELLRLGLTEPRFDPDPVARVRSSIVVSLARKAENPNAIASRLWWKNAFEPHPYARPSDGTPEGVQAVTVDDMRRFMKERIARDVLTVAIVGDITPERLAPLLDATFGKLPAKAAPADIPETSVQRGGRTLLVKKPIPQSVVSFGQPGLKRDDPDWYAALVMNYILGGGGFTSRLTTEVREKRGLAYGVYSYLAPLDHAGILLGGVATKNESVAESIDIIRQEWQRMRDSGPTEAELDGAKTYLTGSFPLQLDSTDHIAAILVDIQQNKLGIDYLDRRNALINGVTLADARRVAKALLKPDALTFVVVGAPDDLKGAQSVDDNGG